MNLSICPSQWNPQNSTRSKDFIELFSKQHVGKFKQLEMMCCSNFRIYNLHIYLSIGVCIDLHAPNCFPQQFINSRKFRELSSIGRAFYGYKRFVHFLDSPHFTNSMRNGMMCEQRLWNFFEIHVVCTPTRLLWKRANILWARWVVIHCDEARSEILLAHKRAANQPNKECTIYLLPFKHYSKISIHTFLVLTHSFLKSYS